ncbi:hypothetical protein JCM6882_006806 [Rhodosporidiobolus microsporus]
MAPKRPVEVLILSDSEDEAAPVASTSRSGASSRGSNRPSGAGDEDEQFESDLARAMALSLDGSGSQGGSQGSTKAVGGAAASRADLERERLERQRMREASGAAPAGAGAAGRTTSSYGVSSNKRARIATLSDLPQDDGAPPPSTSTSSSSSAPSSSSSRIATLGSLGGSSSSSISSASSSSSSKAPQRFWQGAIKRVTNAWHPDPDAWSFDDLIGPKSTLDAAVVSAYCLEPEWVVSHFPTETPLLLVMQGPDGGSGELLQCKLKFNTYIQLVADRKPFQYNGCMHTKLMIYYHSTFVRIVIPTANAVPYDWDTMDNAFFVQDFPLRHPPPDAASEADERSPFTNPTHTDFSKRFFQVAYNLGVPKKFLLVSRLYDFSASGDVRLVQSMQGKWSLLPDPPDPNDKDALPKPAEAHKGGGLCALAKAVSSFQFAPGGRWEIECTGSSLGQLSSSWLSQFYAACKGVSPLSYFPGRRDTKTGKVLSKGSANPPEDVVSSGALKHPVKLPIKVVFPTQAEVLGSWKGVDHGGTLFCRPPTWNGKTYPRHLFHRQQSKRDRVPAHTKIILALHKYKDPHAPTAVHEGWMYLGSHNFTPSAWGSLQNGVGGPQIANNNYELGVVLPIRANSAEELERKASEMVTYKRPLVPYSRDDVAWQQDLFK